MKINEKTVTAAFGAILCFLVVFSYGYFTHSKKIFPYSLISQAREGLTQVSEEDKWYYQPTDKTQSVTIHEEGLEESLILISTVEADNRLAVKIIDNNGLEVHKWEIDWFELWPDASHIPEERRPLSPPGTHVHGATLIENGDLIFNFEQLGLVRMDPCGQVVWKLPMATHHSVFRDDGGNLWVPAEKVHRVVPGMVNHLPFYIEELVLKVSSEGEILKEISIQELLKQNNLNGLLHMSILMDGEKTTTGDILHNNDVEVFPEHWTPGYFGPGDIMVSLRNINTILVFQEADLKVKALSIGEVIKQHDPDFMDGNTISIFDNNMSESVDSSPSSRIVIKSFDGDQQLTTYYTGSDNHMFYSAKMGKHQWLANGNLLITSPFEARAFEIDSMGHIVWEYVNLLGNGFTGLMEQATRLPEQYTREFFKERAANCSS